VGRFYAQKGFDMLIEAWGIVAEKYPEWQLNIYGNGEFKDQLNAQIKEKGLTSSITLKDPVSNIVDKYTESSAYVMSSRFEGFGMVLIEAMACGLPVISFDCPDGPSDIIKDGEDGLLVENGNISKLADSILKLIENEDLRIRMGQKARENVKRYNHDIIMQKWVELFHTLKH